MSDFMRPQQPTESGSAFITRVINKRHEICQSGTQISVEQVKAALMEGLRKEYQPYITDIHGEPHDIGTLRSKLTSACNRVERHMKREATTQHLSAHTSAHFGSAYDALGYQQPPRAIRGRPPAPAHTTVLKSVIDDLRAHLSANMNITDDAYNIVESALMAATTANRVCYYCQQPGHIASSCPLKQQHRQQQGGLRPGWQPPRPGYQHPPGPYQGPPTAGRNSVPNRPILPPRQTISPILPHGENAAPHHRPQHPADPCYEELLVGK
jgi:hypothetical protein